MAKLSLTVTLEQTSAKACKWLGLVLDAVVVDRTVVVVVVVVKLMQVLTEGIMGIGIVGATLGCGLAITPQTTRFLLNSTSHSEMAFFNALLGWYMFGDSVDGTSSPTIPSSVSVSSFMSADTVSSKKIIQNCTNNMKPIF